MKQVGKTAAPVVQSVETIWKSDRPVLDKVTEVLCLGDPAARKLIDEARNPNIAAPTEMPALLKDASKPKFYRANLSLAYARALSNRRIYEESLAVLNNIRAEQVVDPAAYLFHKAVAEHALTKGPEANNTIVRLLGDVEDPPERYKSVGALMVFDILSWKEKDLGAIARKMDNIERRLDLSRGGPTTRKMQKEVVGAPGRVDQGKGKPVQWQAAAVTAATVPVAGRAVSREVPTNRAIRCRTARLPPTVGRGMSIPRGSRKWPRFGASCPNVNEPRPCWS